MSNEKLIDSRRGGWFWLEDELIDRYGREIGAIGVAIYTYLARRADRCGVSFPSYQTIADDLALGRRTVISHMQRLEKLGLISIQRSQGRGRGANTYRLLSLRAQPTPPPAPEPTPSPTSPSMPDPEPQPPLPVAKQVPVPEPQSTSSSLTSPCVAVRQAPVSMPAGRGAAAAPVQELHGEGAGAAPGVVQELHQGGAGAAPQGNPKKETQGKESQKKDEGGRASKDQAGGTELVDALCEVLGKRYALLARRKQEALQEAGRLLARHGYGAEDVQAFEVYWRTAHYIGSRPGAGRPHLSQVLEEMPAAQAWAEAVRQTEAQLDAWEARPRPREAPPAEADALWAELAPVLRMLLPGHPALADVQAMRPRSWRDNVLTLQLPTAAGAARWEQRMRRPVQQALAALDTPCAVQFVGPAVS